MVTSRCGFGIRGFLLIAIAMFSWVEAARASCNLVPGPKECFRGQVGSVDSAFGRPDGAPGDYGDPRVLELTAGMCEGNPKFQDVNGDGTTDASDYVVTVAFKPPRGGTVTIVGLTAGQSCPACDDGGTARCVTGAAAGIVVEPLADRLLFRFPDTATFFPRPGAKRTFTGPTALAVTPSNAKLPCSLGRYTCGSGSAPAGLNICIDELYEKTGCGTSRADRNPRFGSFTALPSTNVWRDVCEDSQGVAPVCKDERPDVRFTVDVEGNVLLPVDWSTILADEPDQPRKKKNRVVTGETRISARKSGTGPIRIPSNDFLSSSTPRGGTWPAGPPLFETPADPDPNAEWLEFSGEADEPESVLRISRREPWAYRCEGGSQAGQACRPNARKPCADAGACVASGSPVYYSCAGGPRRGRYCTSSRECPASQCTPGSVCYQRSGAATATKCTTDAQCAADQECGLGIFEFRDRFADQVGPVLIPKAKYRARAKQYKARAVRGP